jgi:hypothetical protein
LTPSAAVGSSKITTREPKAAALRYRTARRVRRVDLQSGKSRRALAKKPLVRRQAGGDSKCT